jgi:hypothetical protein
MELLLIPVLLLGGAALFHLGVNGVPSLAHLPSFSSPGAGLRSVRVLPQRLRPGGGAPLKAPEPIETKEVPLELADILLADLLTEMMQFREELAALKARVEELTSTREPAARTRKRSVA